MDKNFENEYINIFHSINNSGMSKYQKLIHEFLDDYDRKIKGKVDLPKSNKIQKRTSINNIKSAYKEERLVLVVGAGVSIEFGIPIWDELLQRIMVHTIQKENEVSEVLSTMFNKIFTPNPLIAGRYLQTYFESKNISFEKVVQETLYKNVDKNKKSKMFDEIIKLCVAPGGRPNLDSIISYNFDDLLEYKLRKTNLDIPFISVFGLGTEIKKGELPIYHVHGFLPDNKMNKFEKITFGENNYHQQYSDLYSWNNIVQINKFRDNTCLFIGTSLSDPNIRRLLDISLKQKGNKKKHHYIFKKRISTKYLKEKISNIINDKDKLLKEDKFDNDEALRFLRDIYERFEENDSASLGVQTIWINDWEEIPDIIRRMRESTT